MFADNERISQRQMGRQMGQSLLGVWLFLLTGFLAERGREGIAGLIMGGGFLFVYSFFLVRLAGSYKQFFLRGAKSVKIFITVVVILWAVSAGSLVLRMTAHMVSEYLLPGSSLEYTCLLIIATAMLGSGAKIQTRARMAEISFPLTTGAFLILLLVAAFRMHPIVTVELPDFSMKEMWVSAYHMFTAGSCLGLLPFLLWQVQRPAGTLPVIYRNLGILLAFLGGAAIVLIGTFGQQGTADMGMPILNLMAGGSLPGGFLDRFDIVWMAVLLYSLFFSLGSLLFYSGYLTKQAGGQALLVRVFAAISIWFGAVGSFHGKTILDLAPFLFGKVYTLFFLAVSLFIWSYHHRKGGQRS